MKTSTFPPSPLTEILRALIPKVGEDEADECVEDILYRSLPVPVSAEIAILAGKFKYKGFKGGDSRCHYISYGPSRQSQDCYWRFALQRSPRCSVCQKQLTTFSSGNTCMKL